MREYIREALEKELQRAAQAEYDARYERALEVERENRRAERFVTLDFAHVEAEERVKEAREALTKLGYTFVEPIIASAREPSNLSDAELGL